MHNFSIILVYDTFYLFTETTEQTRHEMKIMHKIEHIVLIECAF